MEYIFAKFHEKIRFIHNIMNKKYRKRLTNKDFTLITSNCAGGIIYHWLGLKFNSPFINLWLTNEDYIKALENFDDFIKTPIIECTSENVDYPVGVGWGDIKLYFMHYDSFENANKKWTERVKRINKRNMGVWLTNWSGEENIIERFDKLPFENKIVFVNKKYMKYESCIYLTGFEKRQGVGQIWKTKNIFGMRYIDEFDFVEWINHMRRGKKNGKEK